MTAYQETYDSDRRGMVFREGSAPLPAEATSVRVIVPDGTWRDAGCWEPEPEAGRDSEQEAPEPTHDSSEAPDALAEDFSKAAPVKKRAAGRTAAPRVRRPPVSECRPDLAAEWHPSRNPGLDPGAVTAGSKKKVWWCCPQCGHEWAATVLSRAHGAGCPECSRSPERSRGRGWTRVRCVETGEVYASLWEAAEACGLRNRSSIRSCLDKPGRTAGGFHWQNVSK